MHDLGCAALIVVAFLFGFALHAFLTLPGD
jgi:hypothetical protein